MKSSWKPDGYNVASPYLVISNPTKVMDFLVTVFDAKPLRQHKASDGRIVHAEMKIGDSVIMMGDSGDGTSTPCHVHVYVEDVEASFEKAKAAGGTVVQEPIKKNDSDKRGGINDPGGAVTWWIGTQVE